MVFTEFQDELQNDSSSTDFKIKYYVCNLSRVQEFIIYRFQIKYDYLDDSITYLDDRVDLISAFPNEHELRALNRMSDLEQARIQIFKLLSQANLEALTEKFKC